MFIDFTDSLSTIVCVPQVTGDESRPVSVLQPLPKPDTAGEVREGDGVVGWKPPHIDWNPWNNRSAYLEGSPYAQLEPVSRWVANDDGSCDVM